MSLKRGRGNGQSKGQVIVKMPRQMAPPRVRVSAAPVEAKFIYANYPAVTASTWTFNIVNDLLLGILNGQRTGRKIYPTKLEFKFASHNLTRVMAILDLEGPGPSAATDVLDSATSPFAFRNPDTLDRFVTLMDKTFNPNYQDLEFMDNFFLDLKRMSQKSNLLKGRMVTTSPNTSTGIVTGAISIFVWCAGTGSSTLTGRHKFSYTD